MGILWHFLGTLKYMGIFRYFRLFLGYSGYFGKFLGILSYFRLFIGYSGYFRVFQGILVYFMVFWVFLDVLG